MSVLRLADSTDDGQNCDLLYNLAEWQGAESPATVALRSVEGGGVSDNSHIQVSG